MRCRDGDTGKIHVVQTPTLSTSNNGRQGQGIDQSRTGPAVQTNLLERAIAGVANAARHPVATGRALWSAVQDTAQALAAGNPHALGRGGFEIAALVLGASITKLGTLDKLSDAARAADKAGEAGRIAARGTDDAITGFRAVSRAEADDIARYGFRPDPAGRSMENKWFSESREGAEWFRNNMSGLDDDVEARVPRVVYDRSYNLIRVACEAQPPCA